MSNFPVSGCKSSASRKRQNFCQLHGDPLRQAAGRRSSVEGQEDCLVVNVYTPRWATDTLPVMVFIHGGGYVAGSGGTDFYGPDMLMDRDVISNTNLNLPPICSV